MTLELDEELTKLKDFTLVSMGSRTNAAMSSVHTNDNRTCDMIPGNDVSTRPELSPAS